MSDFELNIAMTAVNVETTLPLADRIKAAMRDVRKREHEVFWMTTHLTDDFKFHTAVGAVMLKAEGDERDLMERSLKQLRALSAMVQGIPVDFDAVEKGETLPLIGMWHESAE